MIKVRTKEGYELEFDCVADVKEFIGIDTKTAPMVTLPKREPYVPKYIKLREQKEQQQLDAMDSFAGKKITTEPEKVNYPMVAKKEIVTKYWTLRVGNSKRVYNWQAIAEHMDVHMTKPMTFLDMRNKYGFKVFHNEYYKRLKRNMKTKTICDRGLIKRMDNVNVKPINKQQPYGSKTVDAKKINMGQVFDEMDRNKTASFAYVFKKLGFDRKSYPHHYANMKRYAKENAIDLTEYWERGRRFIPSLAQVNTKRQTNQLESVDVPFPVLEHFDMAMYPMLVGIIEKMVQDKEVTLSKDMEGKILGIRNWGSFATEFMSRTQQIADHFKVKNHFKIAKNYEVIRYER